METNSINTIVQDTDDLTPVQKQKYHLFLTIIGAEAIELVRHLDARGRNSSTSVYDKIKALVDADRLLQAYHDTLYESFEVNVPVTPFQIIETVSAVRSHLNLPPYMVKTKKNCEDDFMGLFIVRDTKIDNNGVEQMAYIPLFRLKPSEE